MAQHMSGQSSGSGGLSSGGGGGNGPGGSSSTSTGGGSGTGSDKASGTPLSGSSIGGPGNMNSHYGGHSQGSRQSQGMYGGGQVIVMHPYGRHSAFGCEPCAAVIFLSDADRC